MSKESFEDMSQEERDKIRFARTLKCLSYEFGDIVKKTNISKENYYRYVNPLD
jgi:hypothetical protein